MKIKNKIQRLIINSRKQKVIIFPKVDSTQQLNTDGMRHSFSLYDFPDLHCSLKDFLMNSLIFFSLIDVRSALLYEVLPTAFVSSPYISSCKCPTHTILFWLLLS
jgi:hypothetical protein